MGLRYIGVTKRSALFGRTFLDRVDKFWTHAFHEVTETACRLTGSFGIRIATKKEKGGKIR